MAGLHVALETGADEAGSRPGPPLSDPSERFLNRELSWLEFNARVLALAEDPQLALLERVKFLAIFSENLDEFFEVRVAGLMEQLAAGVRATTPDGLGLIGQLRAIRNRVDQLVARAAAVFGAEITPALEAAGIRFVDWDELSDADQLHLDELFAERIFPVLTPLAVDPAHPFPYISNLSLN
ncbi:MAG: RNA degradosome polyphosphate kinase, partial [Acidimicrobiia bacterium]